MNIEQALIITNDRIDSINRSIYTNESERRIADETLEYLKFVQNILEGMKN